jgi:hypothetical protein
MEAVRTSETSVDNHSTRQYNPEDSSEHHTRRRENFKSQHLTTSVNTEEVINEFKTVLSLIEGSFFKTKQKNLKIYKFCVLIICNMFQEFQK